MSRVSVMSRPLKLVTRSEAAELLRVSQKTIERWERDGRLPALRVGMGVRYRQEDIDALIRESA